MATMFPADVTSFLTSGEEATYSFLQRTARPDGKFLCWYAPDIEDREPDFILLSPDCGLVVLEVKDWIIDQLLEVDGKSVLLSGCAHNGILNILDRYRELYGDAPDVVISGFHMKKTGEYTPEEIATIRETAQLLKQWPCLFYTCHCTGLAAYEMMKEIMGDQLQYLHCGEQIEI
ncbi:NERD domain-containing protein [Desulfovibrio sp.]|uniref:NERD domain-containing protein n=1 Tax=Desulfovibrio sp. TaxID=885 RepID=UPI0025796C8E|nr:NERD domain-containing protein [Desulfovibrio sp.]MBR2611157.1 NERD domain-containing protein [Desulfovibrio sp.]